MEKSLNGEKVSEENLKNKFDSFPLKIKSVNASDNFNCNNIPFIANNNKTRSNDEDFYFNPRVENETKNTNLSDMKQDYVYENVTANMKDTNPINVNEINCEFKDVFIDKPSTSGLTKQSVSDSNKLNCSRSEMEISDHDDDDDDDDHSYYEAIVSHNYSEVSVIRERPSSLSFHKSKRRVLKISPEEISSPDSPVSEEEINKIFTPDTDLQDDIETSILEELNNSSLSSKIPELTLKEERSDMKNWKACTIGGTKRQIDMKVIEPYKRVLSHGGYLTTGSHNAIITFSTCFLPHKSRVDYNYVMDNLFFYVLYTLNQLVTDDYVLVYLHGGTVKDCIPTFSWLKRCYRMIDRKLKKNLKALYLVHPTFWLKTLVIMIKPFISSKFSRKMHFINSLAELYDILPIEEASIPDKVKQYDRIKLSLQQKRQ